MNAQTISNETEQVVSIQEVQNHDVNNIVHTKNTEETVDSDTRKKDPVQTQWPLRLVKTEMQLNPPRAILGLPNGDEIVIRSGSFIEEHKLVVMGIGSRTVSLAKVHEQGDHARIETIQLFSLND